MILRTTRPPTAPWIPAGRPGASGTLQRQRQGYPAPHPRPPAFIHQLCRRSYAAGSAQQDTREPGKIPDPPVRILPPGVLRALITHLLPRTRALTLFPSPSYEFDNRTAGTGKHDFIDRVKLFTILYYCDSLRLVSHDTKPQINVMLNVDLDERLGQ